MAVIARLNAQTSYCTGCLTALDGDRKLDVIRANSPSQLASASEQSTRSPTSRRRRTSNDDDVARVADTIAVAGQLQSAVSELRKDEGSDLDKPEFSFLVEADTLLTRKQRALLSDKCSSPLDFAKNGAPLVRANSDPHSKEPRRVSFESPALARPAATRKHRSRRRSAELATNQRRANDSPALERHRDRARSPLSSVAKRSVTRSPRRRSGPSSPRPPRIPTPLTSPRVSSPLASPRTTTTADTADSDSE